MISRFMDECANMECVATLTTENLCTHIFFDNFFEYVYIEIRFLDRLIQECIV